jgi:hypothetical protein
MPCAIGVLDGSAALYVCYASAGRSALFKRWWLRANVEFVATKKGMSAALALAAHSSSELSAYSSDRLTKAVGGLGQAIEVGKVRADISPGDLLRALVGMCYMHDQPGWQASVLRLLDVFVDGLCCHSGTGRS